MIDLQNKKIILFDGVCNLCASSVQFLIKKNKQKNINFASLQSTAGQEILEYFGLSKTKFNSFVFVNDGEIFLKSKAALNVVKYLDKPWPILSIFKIIPSIISNWVYDIVAKNRYKWFGEKNECWIPTPELKSRFLN